MVKLIKDLVEEITKSTSIKDKVNDARIHAKESFGAVDYGKTERLVSQKAKAAGVKLTASEFARVVKIMQPNRQNDANRTLARGTSIAKIQAKKASEARVTAAVSGATKKKKKKK
jgi:hypothetical protein